MGSIASGIGDMFSKGLGGTLGGLTTGASKDFTPQNEFQASSYQIPNQQFADAIKQSQAQQGTNNTSQQALADALIAQSHGGGANPAQAMLNQATDQNMKQSAGMIASQRGINPALAQRMAAQNAANINQQAAGQGAVMGAQQQLGAQQSLGGLYNNMANQNLNYQQTLQNAQANQNAANIQQNLGVQGINASVAAGNARANQNTTSGLLSGLSGSGAQSMMGGGGGGGGMMGMAAMAGAHGGMVPGYADGGAVLNYDPNGIFGNELAQTQSQMAQLNPLNFAGGNNDPKKNPFPSNNLTQPELGSSSGYANKPLTGEGSLTSDLPSLDGSSTGSNLGAGSLSEGMNFKSGGNVPGKPKAKGDSYKNDTVPAMLSPGEIVVPRSKANDVDKAKEFVEQLIKRKKGGSSGEASYSKVLEAHRKLGEQLKSMGG